MSSGSSTEDGESTGDEIYGTEHDADFDSVVPDHKPDSVREAEQKREQREADADAAEPLSDEERGAAAMGQAEYDVVPDIGSGPETDEETNGDEEDSPAAAGVSEAALAERDARIDELEQELEQVRAEKSELADELDRMRNVQQNLLSRMEQVEKELDGEVIDSGTTELDKWTSAPQSMLENLSANKRKAVILAKHWDEISWRKDKHEAWNVNTGDRANAKNHPGKLKFRLSKKLDEEPESATLYRIMKHVAKMSGGEEEVDTNGRTHIRGGEFEYHEKPNPGGQSTKKVLKEVEQ